jgi:predicted AAA+ superfamily ATPase
MPQLGFSIPAPTLLRFWRMIASSNGQIWNASQISASLGVTDKIVKRYLDILSGAYMIRQLPPWFENLRKRQVKSPKIYIRDSGLLHTLLSLPDDGIFGHHQLGNSWEGFVIEQIEALLQPQDMYFWSTHAGAELDLLIFRNGRKIGFEIKYSDAPRTTKSMHTALHDLDLKHLFVIYPGSQDYELTEKISVIGITNLPGQLESVSHL